MTTRYYPARWLVVCDGDAPSYEAARDAAVAEIQRRMDDRIAVL